MLANKSYVMKKLEALNTAEVSRVRQAFIKNAVLRFIKYFHTGWGVPYTGKPYGKAITRYGENILAADLETLGELIRICGLLLQTKVYLFWDRTWSGKSLQQCARRHLNAI